MKKGDVLGVARIAGIMAAKETSRLIPLCHNIPLSGVEVGVEVVLGRECEGYERKDEGEGADEGASERILRADDATLTPVLSSTRSILRQTSSGGAILTARVHTYGQTGVEMEALTAASVASLTVYDMCKAVDRGMRMEGLRVVLKEGGRSGSWREGVDGMVVEG